MKSRLAVKLFLVLLLTVSVAVAAMMLLMRWSLDRGFTDYINRMNEAQLQQVAEGLESFYERAGSWRPLREQPGLWPALTGNGERGGHPPPPPRGGPFARPPGPHPGPRMLDIGPRLTLFDAEGQAVIGRAREMTGLTSRALEAGGETVGWLALRPLEAPRAEHDVEFFQRQSKRLYAIGALVLVVAAVASLLLAWRLLVPVRALAAGARRLTRGDYGARVPEDRGDELGLLAADFNRLAETLAATEHARRRWIADISHELRTPLAVLQGEIEAAQDGVRPFDATTLQSLHNEVGRLNKLVNDLYQLSLSDLGALDYQEQRLLLSELLEEVVAAQGDRFTAAGLELALDTGDTPIEVIADPDRLAQLVNNLLENSLRYTDAGGRVRVSCSLAEGGAHLDVQDSAPAVAPNALPHLFERLFREEASRNRARGGAGLGLAIARNIAEAHRGRISAHPSPLGGLWVRVWLPLAEGDSHER